MKRMLLVGLLAALVAVAWPKPASAGVHVSIGIPFPPVGVVIGGPVYAPAPVYAPVYAPYPVYGPVYHRSYYRPYRAYHGYYGGGYYGGYHYGHRHHRHCRH